MRARYVVGIGPGDGGRRVSVRARTHGDPPATDTVGILRSWEGDALAIERRDGTITRIPLADVLAGRVVPDSPAGGGPASLGARSAGGTAMTDDEEAVPVRPRKPAAPETHPLELQRLALQERTHPDCEPLAVQTIIWLFRAYNAAMNAQSDELRALGLSPSAFNVLMALRNTPGHVLEPYELSERLLVSRPSVTGLLDTLQGKRLILRRPHSHDRRRVLVELTEAGHRVLEEHFPAHYTAMNALVGDLSAYEMATLVTLLRRIRGAAPEHLTR